MPDSVIFTAPTQQSNAAPFRVYSWYRLALAVALIAMLALTRKEPLVGGDNPPLFIALCGVYFLFTLLCLIFLPTTKQLSKQQLFVNFFIDIGILIALSHLSGGTTGGLGLLLLVSVAASSLLLSGQIALLVAALATLALLADTIYLLSSSTHTDQSLLTAGTLGTLFFAASLGFQVLSQRLRSSQQLAQERAADVSKLQNLNQLIVQRMRTGILVVDADSRIKMLNQAAAEFLHDDRGQPAQAKLLDSDLQQQLDAWKKYPDTHSQAFRHSSTGPELMARFTALQNEQGSEQIGDTLIFIEDSGQLAQRAQQLKLAALGRLTASIAHEIRNPLGAISHAGQLLRESPQLDSSDQRLTDIIVNHARRINNIIENVLQLSRRTPPNPRRIDLAAWLHDYVEEYRQGHAAPAAITIHETVKVEVTVDTDQLSQALTNLLDNALRYSEQATGHASAELLVDGGAKQLPQLDVIDYGVGIAERDREKVFEPFFTTEAKGNGLGLYMARELCEINQARLHYLRNKDGQSCFRINFSHPDRKPLFNE